MHGVAEFEIPRITSASPVDDRKLRMAVSIKARHGIGEGKLRRCPLAMGTEICVAASAGFIR
jgi:hypothetical protein